MNFLQTLKKESERVVKLLEKFTVRLPDNAVTTAVRYSLFSGGKHLRPCIVLQAARMLGAKSNDEGIERIAAAIEMIHAYSLIHDDLPCMDDDGFRRGKPSCHKRFGEGIAVLAGDALLNLAFETLLDGKPSEHYFYAMKLIADCAGLNGMIGGQAEDISLGSKTTLSQVVSLSKKKTAALFRASTAAAGVCLSCTDEQLVNLCVIGENFGLAFQIKDDLLDKDKDEASSFVKVLGETETYAKLDEYTGKAKKALTVFGESGGFFRELLNFNVERNA